MQDRIEESGNSEKEYRHLIKRLDAREQELLSLRDHIHSQEKQLDEYRLKLKDEQMSREQEFQNELKKRDYIFAEREKFFRERQSEFELNILKRETEIQALKDRLQNEITVREQKLQQAKQEIEQEKERYNEENRKKIERTSKDYVSVALDLLERKEKDFHSKSKVWGITGALSIFVGLVFFICTSIVSYLSIQNPVTWEFIAFIAFKGLIIVSLFAALAKYSLTFSNSYMREALKNADRRHAINFGKFYLESYGASAEWTQIKEAFENWNITGENSFSKPENSNIDVTGFEKLAISFEKIVKSISALNNGKNT